MSAYQNRASGSRGEEVLKIGTKVKERQVKGLRNGLEILKTNKEKI